MRRASDYDPCLRCSVDGYAEIPYNKGLRFEWDENKNEANQRKHGVPFETALRVFADPHCLLFVERIQDGEERWHAIGAVRDTFFLTVVHTYREDGKANEVVRIVSARPATRSEVKLYVKSNYGG